tara:strand:- start:607 stop:990 length:384 start_codon:yes stop_codon:yes gene_type:complete
LGDDTLIKEKSEDREQIEFVSWVKRNYPEEKVIHIPNGKKRSIIDAVRLKAMGVMKGVPDLFFPSLYLWIEMKKVKDGKLSPEQKAVMESLRRDGYRVAVCKGAEEAKSLFLSYKTLQHDQPCTPKI